MASTAIRAPEDMTIRNRTGGEASGLDVQHLPAAIEAGLGIHAMGPEKGAIGRVFGELRRYESVGGPPIGATAFGLLAFWIGHGIA
jgi:hypothetical protein